MTEWPEDRKNRCLSVSTNSAGLHFRESVQKIKKKTAKKKQTNKQTKRKKEKVQNGQESMAGKKLALMHIWGKTLLILQFLQIFV